MNSTTTTTPAPNNSDNNGETNLRTLLTSMSPILHAETYVFLTTTTPLPSLPLSTLQPELTFQEPEGLTLITTLASAHAHGFTNYTFPCKKLSLQVHSSLQAVGLIAAVSERLAKNGISANVVSGFYHDHVFVPVGMGEVALGVLRGLVEEVSGGPGMGR